MIVTATGYVIRWYDTEGKTNKGKQIWQTMRVTPWQTMTAMKWQKMTTIWNDSMITVVSLNYTVIMYIRSTRSDTFVNLGRLGVGEALFHAKKPREKSVWGKQLITGHWNHWTLKSMVTLTLSLPVTLPVTHAVYTSTFPLSIFSKDAMYYQFQQISRVCF